MGRARLAEEPGAVTIIECIGNFTAVEDGKQVSELVEAQMKKGDRHFIVDLSQVSHFGMGTLGAFITSYKLLAQCDSDSSLKLAGVPDSAVRVMAPTKMHEIFEIYPDVAQAQASYAERGQEGPSSGLHIG